MQASSGSGGRSGPASAAAQPQDSKDRAGPQSSGIQAPSISLPKGGGAIRGIGEKFAANPVTGTGSMTVPIATSPGRSGFGPELSLSYDSGSGNGPYGFGWSLSLPSVTRKTDKGLPQYRDAEESDVFILSGAEDLVPVLVENNGKRERRSFDSPPSEPGYTVRRYRPRIEGLFARIECWTDNQTGISHWRSISKDNITTLYGKRKDARIADPADPSNIFSWLICESYDDKGNAILYEYKSEDDKNVDHSAPQEQNRLVGTQFAQRYLKRIKYGNRIANRDGRWNATDPAQITDWSFEVVFDYGEHDLAIPTTKEAQPWPVRQDSFSSYRAAFEIRTYRLCRRVLIFHHFAAELGTADCLVRSTNFDYSESSIASFITSVTQSGYVRKQDGTYLAKSLPKLQFGYTEVHVDETVHEIDPSSIENLPYGSDGSRYQWVDLDSEGLSGVLTEQAGAWFYKRNLGDGIFGRLELVGKQPSFAALGSGQQLLDLAGDGLLDLVQFDAPAPGFYERTQEGDWASFAPFVSLPKVAWKDPNLRFVDLTGDGHADILIAEEKVFTWHSSLGEEGFGSAQRTPQARDEEKGAKLVFADGTQSIFVADMSGDGLVDLARIRNGEVCYWPNLGYGRFGAKVAMSNPPVFDHGDIFDPRRIRLADIDGSGNTDIIYLAQDEVRLYFNQSGNGWTAPQRLTRFPSIDDVRSVTAVDLLGNGTACLVWSSPLSGDTRQPMRYIDLMGGQKPHLLVYINNSMGAETQVSYAASTRFFLQDRAEGHPWVTRLPFPVHVIERTEARDLVSNTRLVSTYRYRHGYFDGVEREFRGFAYVEQRDAESVVDQFDLPAVVTKTWFHTGAYLRGDQLEAHFKNPKNSEYCIADNRAVFLPDTELPTDLSADEAREACRALKGSILRQEVYANDGTPKAPLPYSVSERSYHLRRLQPRGTNRHAVFFSHASETIDYHYERSFVPEPADPEPDPQKKRMLSDPRVSHGLTLEVDEFGNVVKSAAVGYGRRQPDQDLKPEERTKQTRTLITYTENTVINKSNETDWYRVGVPAEMRTFEITGAQPAAMAFTLAEVGAAARDASEIPYEQMPDGSLQKRPIERLRTLYRKNDLSSLLPPGQVESMALPGESFKLAFTPGLLDVFQSKASRANLTALLTGSEGRYRELDYNGSLWIPAGSVFYSPNPADAIPQELAFAREHFFLPHRFQDPFGNNMVVAYDENHKLLIDSTRDAVDNVVRASNDYRVLQPRLVTDPNGNRTEVRFDALGMVVGTAVMGKALGPAEGDTFAAFDADLTAQEIRDFFDAPNPRPLAVGHLGTATARIIYDLERVPACAASIARETHVSDLAPGEATKVQLSFVYSDGFGREALTKIQAEPGPLDPGNANSPILDPRWVGTGAKLYNNKGKPVRQYEPFFSPTHHFGIEQHGVSSTLFYDPVERVVATLHPNHTYEKVVFDPWRQVTYDVNDTVTFDPTTDADVAEFFGGLPDAEVFPTWYQQRIGGAKGAAERSAAERAAAHADTPTIAFFDTLGRTFLTIADNGRDANGSDRKYHTRTELDIEGNQRAVRDPLDRIVMKYDYDMLGNRIHQASMEAGERWMLDNVAGKPIRAWDSRDHMLRTTYDAALRPTQLYVKFAAAPEILVEKTVYGEGQGDAENHRGQIYQHFDSAGVVTNGGFDFKGNLRRGTRQLAREYRTAPDWSSNPAPILEDELFTSGMRYDALNRTIQLVAPHSNRSARVNVIQPGYNEANLLERVDAWLGSAVSPSALLDAQSTDFHPVLNVDYNAKAQRTKIEYGNGAVTEYTYDQQTFRLTRLRTTRPAPTGLRRLMNRLTRHAGSEDTSACQDLSYVYDPVGNITAIRDDAQQTIFFKGQVVPPHSDYTYDAIYRLTQATGREPIGQVGRPETTWNNESRVRLPHPGDGQAMRNYTEAYEYDAAGNFEELIHQAANGSWTRSYAYNEASLIEPGRRSNRLSGTTVGNGAPETYTYDAHGNMTRLPHLPTMQWDYRDQLQATAQQMVNSGTPETTWYVYDAGGQRVRKATDHQVAAGQMPIRKAERIYLGSLEIYREYIKDGSTSKLERETLHIMDNEQRIALVETRTQGNDGSPGQIIRYLFGNHLGSASLELDDKENVISYEEYYPYGSTSYQAVDKNIKAADRRYRYTGKELDEESGFYYHGARYYAPWLGRWVTADPTGPGDSLNLYVSVMDNPVVLVDSTGHESRRAGYLPLHPLLQSEYEGLLADIREQEKLVKNKFVPPQAKFSLFEKERYKELKKNPGELKLEVGFDLGRVEKEIGTHWLGLTLYARGAGIRGQVGASAKEGKIGVGAEAHFGAVGAKLRLCLGDSCVNLKLEGMAGGAVNWELGKKGAMTKLAFVGLGVEFASRSEDTSSDEFSKRFNVLAYKNIGLWLRTALEMYGTAVVLRKEIEHLRELEKQAKATELWSRLASDQISLDEAAAERSKYADQPREKWIITNPEAAAKEHLANQFQRKARMIESQVHRELKRLRQ